MPAVRFAPPPPLLALLALSACGVADLLRPELPNCDPRLPFFEDADGDGQGDPGGAVYIGCEAPEGYVEVPPDTDMPADDTDDTDDPDTYDADTDTPDTDTDGADTDTPDTDTDGADTDPVDTDAADTDTDTDGPGPA
jgi:hypothetical protein